MARDSSLPEKVQKIETELKESSQKLKELKSLLPKEAENSPLIATTSLAESNMFEQTTLHTKNTAAAIPRKEQWIQSFTKKVLRRAKKNARTHDQEKPKTKSDVIVRPRTATIKDTTTSSNQPRWQFRSPITRRSTPKENPLQAAEIERLTEALKLESLKQAEKLIVVTEREPDKDRLKLLDDYKTAVARLEEEKLERQPKLKEFELKIKTLEEEIRLRQPLVDVGIAIRIRSFEKYKVETDATKKEDTAIVRRGNKAAHDGNVGADAALFHLKALSEDSHGRAFQDIYKIGTPAAYLSLRLSVRAAEIVSLRGTIELAVAAHLLDQSLYERFESLEKIFRESLIDDENAGVLSRAAAAMYNGQDIERVAVEMGMLAAQVHNQARKAKCSGTVPRTAKELERRKLREEQKLATTEVGTTTTEQKPSVIQGESAIADDKPKNKKKKKEEEVQAEATVVQRNTVDIHAAATDGVELGQLPQVQVVVEGPGFFGTIAQFFYYLL